MVSETDNHEIYNLNKELTTATCIHRSGCSVIAVHTSKHACECVPQCSPSSWGPPGLVPRPSSASPPGAAAAPPASPHACASDAPCPLPVVSIEVA